MILALALLVAAADRPVVVSALTTDQLVEQCRGKDNDPAPTFCTGYILAAFDTLLPVADALLQYRGHGDRA